MSEDIRNKQLDDKEIKNHKESDEFPASRTMNQTNELAVNKNIMCKILTLKLTKFNVYLCRNFTKI